MTVIISGTDGVSDVDGDASTPALRGTDANSGIFFGADQVGVATNGVERVEFGNSETVFNDGGADVDFRVEGDSDANLLFVDASADKVGIGTSSPSTKLDVLRASTNTTAFGEAQFQLINSATATANQRVDLAMRWQDGTYNGTGGISMLRESATARSGALIFAPTASDGNGTERARITSGGNFLFAGTNTAPAVNNVVGVSIGAGAVAAQVEVSTNLMLGIIVNRGGDDGQLIQFRQAGIEEGNISVSGSTVSYNPFLGSHSGALADWSRPDIKIGTVMDTIDELLEYKVVVIDVQEEVPAKEAVLDEEGNEVEPAQEATTQTVQKRISYNGNGAVGSTATVEYEGQEYTGTIQHEREEPLSFNKHLKVKVNDTAASKAVFGVFVGWNNDSNNDGGVYNDMLVGAVGNYVIRMAAGQEPQIGDLVEADGNGCAVVQDDDIIRTKTIAKVTSTIKQVTYDDGSFLVTCVLYCG